jgi:hypothetical protein
MGRGIRLMMVDQQEVVRRFHRVLIREFGSRPPYDLGAPLIVADICHNLVPYETRGEELGVETTSEYEFALLCLLAGEGGYARVGGKSEARRIRKLVDSPDLEEGAYREFLTTDVHLTPVEDVHLDPVEDVDLNPVEEEMELTEETRGNLPLFEDCPSCSEALPQEAGVHFCPWCGEDVRRVLCTSCSRELRLNWRFCVECGTEVEAESGH